MNIKHPELLILLLLLPLALMFFVYVWKRRAKVLSLLCTDSKLKQLFPKSSKYRVFIRMSLLFFALIMFVLSIISPRWGYDWKEVETKGVNIIVALDLSESMLASDIAPSRLTRAKFEVNKLIDKLTGDRVGLIIFAGDAFLQVPLTHDYLMVKDWVSNLSTDAIDVPGTSVKSAIETAIKAFSFIESEGKVLILISDGEEQDQETLDAANNAASAGIKIFSIGVGTSEGAPIETGSGLLRDAQGNVVISRLDDKLLKEIASITGGYYVRSSTGDFHLNTIYYDHIKNLIDPEILKSGKTKRWNETYQIFMTLALIALFLELCMSFDFSLGELFRGLFKKKKVIHK